MSVSLLAIKNIRTLVAVAAIVMALVVCLFGIRFYLNEIRHDGHIHFPLQPQGHFVEQPHVTESSGERQISWVLPQNCNINAYEVVTGDYVEDEHWTEYFGGNNITCTTGTGGSSLCATPIEDRLESLLQEGNELWFVAKGSLCENGAGNVVSEKLVMKD